MSGTSMDGIDLSLIKTDGKKLIEILCEKNYKYTNKYRNKLRELIKKLPKSKKDKILFSKENENFITYNFIKNIKRFIKFIKFKQNKIDLIGLSGQTIYHNADEKISIQLGCAKEIYKEINIPIIYDFRQNDLKNGGQGAPIGSFYHKIILNRIQKKVCIINLGGIANLTIFNRGNLISYDMGPANTLIDDLCKHFYKKNYDINGNYASKGKIIKKIFLSFKKNPYFKKNYPKSLDREDFNFYLNKLIMHKANDSIHTASLMTVFGLVKGLTLLNKKIELIILSGGGRKNLFIKKNLIKYLKNKNIKVEDIDNYGLNGDFIESQMFGYLAVRSIKKLSISCPTTTGVKKNLTGGVKFGKLIKC